VVDTCNTGPCGTGLLNASRNSARAFWVGGAGIDWAFTGNWTLSIEYLYLGLNETFPVCGPGGGDAAGSTFCSNRSLDGLHTWKAGLNYKLY